MLLMMAMLTAMAQDTSIEAKTATSSQAGSLWADGRTRMLVGMEGNARMVGDLITVTISERTSTSLVAGTLTTRNSQVTAGVGSVFGLEQKLFALYPELGGRIEMDSTAGADFRGDGTTTREGALQGTLTCKVIEVRPNGNLVVLGWKEVRSNKETQYLSLSGMVR
ncbi:MAG: hypothetical protein CMO72_05600, partial [Verrucomicrobiales bacterium]|nr:hypothetical protein [Verrucomicrobiales bacterium]